MLAKIKKIISFDCNPVKVFVKIYIAWFALGFLSLILILSCVAKDAARIEQGGVTGIQSGAIVGVEKGAVKIDPKLLDEFNQSIKEAKQVLTGLVNHSEEINNSGTIKYGGAGWVVIGAMGSILLFMAAGITILYILLKNRTESLRLTTEAVHTCPEHVRQKIKDKINYITSNGGPFGEKHKNKLAKFVKKNGVDA